LTIHPASVNVALGDGRLSLERQPSQQFDMLVIDAFSGDTEFRTWTDDLFHHVQHLEVT
jgi:hypothetical protein